MLDIFFTEVLSALIIGSITYVVVWGIHNFELTLDTIMAWADRQETFLQKAISCPVCLTTHTSVALSSLHCIAFGIGLWRWIGITLLSTLLALWMVRVLNPLDRESKIKN